MTAHMSATPLGEEAGSRRSCSFRELAQRLIGHCCSSENHAAGSSFEMVQKHRQEDASRVPLGEDCTDTSLSRKFSKEQ